MSIKEINKSLEKLWATQISQTILDLNEPSIEFRIIAIEDDHHSAVYRLRCSGLIGIEYSGRPIHANYSELTAAKAEGAKFEGADSVRLSLEIWSDEMVVHCLAVNIETIAKDDR